MNALHCDLKHELGQFEEEICIEYFTQQEFNL